MTQKLQLPDQPTQQQILEWLNIHGLPSECLEPIEIWIEACDEDKVQYGPGFAMNLMSIAMDNCIEYKDASNLDLLMQQYSSYKG